jgi:hypothetical protein
MKKQRLIQGVLGTALCMLLASVAPTMAQAQTEQQKQERARVDEAVNKGLEEMGMPICTGIEWQKATEAEKVAFVWGVCHVVTIEKILAQKFPSLKAEDFSTKASEGMAGMKINDIVRTVDEFYAANPTQMGKPVIGVIWDGIVKPKLKTGIAGNPLKKE